MERTYPRVNRPHDSHMPIHQGALASHRPNTQAVNTTTSAHSLALVATPMHTLERRTSGRLGQPLRPCLLAGLERAQRPLLQTSTIFHEWAAPNYQSWSWPMDRGQGKRFSSHSASLGAVMITSGCIPTT